jgi:hypothetical protein
MHDYRICSITEDDHIASTPLTIVCEDDQTAIQVPRSCWSAMMFSCGGAAARGRYDIEMLGSQETIPIFSSGRGRVVVRGRHRANYG